MILQRCDFVISLFFFSWRVSAAKEEKHSPIFVVVSSRPLSREQKAVLIDARRDMPPASFPAFIENMKDLWGNNVP